jgi:hypothetical protein
VHAGDLVPARLAMTVSEPLPYGTQLALVGSAAEMGGWEVARGVFLTPQDNPLTLACDTQLPCGLDVQYKARACLCVVFFGGAEVAMSSNIKSLAMHTFAFWFASDCHVIICM